MEAFLFTVDGHRYGVRKDGIISVERVGAVHRLPFLKSSLTVLAVIGDHTRTLAELPPCLGHEPSRGNGGASAFVMTDEGPIRGFMVGADLSAREIDDRSIIPVPDFLQMPFVEAFLSDDGELVPVIALGALFGQVVKERRAPRVAERAVRDLPGGEPARSAPFRLFTSGGNLLAIQAEEATARPRERYRISRFPLLPTDIEGIVLVENRLLPVVDLALRIARRSGVESGTLLDARVGNASFALLVDETRGEWDPGDTLTRDLPSICSTPWMRAAAVHGRHVAPIIDVGALVSAPPGGTDTKPISDRSTPGSDFSSRFGREDVDVIEVLVQGRRWGIPKTEVIDFVDRAPLFPIPNPRGIVAGIGSLKNELLPVLDLSRILGTSAPTTGVRHAILHSNGAFRALILTETAAASKRIKVASHREVPVALPYPVVYGCYTEGEAVRLILNVHELALHFDESRAAELLAPLAPVETESWTDPVQLPDVQPTVDEPRTIRVEIPMVDETASPTAKAAEEASPSGPALDEKMLRAEPPRGEPPLRESHRGETFRAETFRGEPPRAKQPRVNQEREPVVSEPRRPETVPTALIDASMPASRASPAPEPVLEEETVVEPVPRLPTFRGWRTLVGFVASAALIFGVVAALYYFGLTHEPLSQSLPPAPAAAAHEPLSVARSPTPAETSQASGIQIYVVKEGDTLWDISNRLTGDPLNYRWIAGQNRIANPDLIFPGQALRTSPDSSASK